MEFKCDVYDKIMKSQALLEFHVKYKKHTKMVVELWAQIDAHMCC